jgi:hypothetical protein
MNYIYRISPAIFFTLAVKICFCLPFLKYHLLFAIGNPLFRALIYGEILGLTHWAPVLSHWREQSSDVRQSKIIKHCRRHWAAKQYNRLRSITFLLIVKRLALVFDQNILLGFAYTVACHRVGFFLRSKIVQSYVEYRSEFKITVCNKQCVQYIHLVKIITAFSFAKQCQR